MHIPQRAFWWTLVLLVPLGCLLDFVFAQWFFQYPNVGVTLGILAPALGRPVPIEEYIFSVTGFLIHLLLYVWLGEFWLASYNVPDYPGDARKVRRLLLFIPSRCSRLCFSWRLHGSTRSTSHSPKTRPVSRAISCSWSLELLLPAMAFFPVAKPFINWRALSLTLFFMALLSVIWEATLAVPYQWWGFQRRQMIGLFIGAWSGLPVEEVFVWIAVTYATVIVFEIVKVLLVSERSVSDTLVAREVHSDA